MWTDRRTDRQTDMIKIIVAFGNFAKAPKNPQPIFGVPIGVGVCCLPKVEFLQMCLTLSEIYAS